MNSLYKKSIKGKTILITGGTGSFGHHVIEKLLKLNPKKVIIFSRDEKKQFDMRNKFSSPLLRFVIGDVRDRDSVNKVTRGVDYIFHAAALKQVPTCEFFPLEAIKTNILGATNVIELGIKNRVKKIVLLSTDKAAYPINTMGMSKALMEKVMLSSAREFQSSKYNKTIVCAVRYGNVLFSRGSVVPYFISLMKKNKKLTVTDLHMTRFLLPLEDAVDLVLFALSSGKSGHIYVKNSPASTIETLANALCQIFSYKKGYEEVGIRAGEKMHETLITEEEMLRAVKQKNYFIVPPESYDLDYSKYFFKGKKIKENVKPFTSENTVRFNVKETIQCLLKLAEIKEELKSFKSKEKPLLLHT